MRLGSLASKVRAVDSTVFLCGSSLVQVMKPEYFADSVTAGLTTDTQPVAAPTHGEKRGVVLIGLGGDCF